MKNNFKIFIALLLVFGLLSPYFPLSNNIAEANPASWLTGWDYRRAITIDNTGGGALTDYQVSLNTNSALYNESGLVGSWHMNENSGQEVYDMSGNSNNGIYKGSSLSFDGVDDYVGIGTGNDYFPLPLFSICTWVKSPGLAPGMTLNGIISFTYGLTMSLDSSGRFSTRMDNGSSLLTLTAPDNLYDNKFHHLCLTFDGSERYLFVDGTIKNNAEITWLGTTRWPTNTSNIGHENNNSSVYKFNGSIDEIRLYNVALSPDQVTRLYHGDFSQDPTANLESLWHFDEGTGTTAGDDSGNAHNGTLLPTGSEPIWSTDSPAIWTDGKYDSGLSFDGVDNYVDLGSSNNITGDNLQTITISAWLKTSAIINQYALAINRSSSVSTLISLSSNQDSAGANVSGYLGFVTAKPDGTGHTWLVYNGNYNDNEWHYVTAVVNGSTRTLYIDGINRGSDSQGMQSVVGNTSIASIGSHGGASSFFNGAIDEVRIYNRALSEDEALAHFNASKVRLDYGDVRFTDSDGTTQLNYWMEKDGTFWTKVPSISASSQKTIYMYYGNASAVSGSSRANTFDFSGVGTYISSFSDANIAPNHGATYDGTNFYISNSTYVNKFDNNWSYISQYPSLDIYTGICWDEKNNRFYGIDWTNKQWSAFNSSFVESTVAGLYDMAVGGEPIDCATDGGYIYTNHRIGQICRNKISDNSKDCINMDTLSGIDWGGQGITYLHKYLYAGTSPFGTNSGRIYIIDIADWLNPQIITYWDTNGRVTGVDEVAGLINDTYFIYQTDRDADYALKWQSHVKYTSPEPTTSIYAEQNNYTFTYRQAVTIDNTSNANTLYDYQVLVETDTATPITAGHMNSDCSDIRFTDDSANWNDHSWDYSYSYWIESGCNTSSTKIWVKVPSIASSAEKTIYMYYGNASATSQSNGGATFSFFDDFEDGSIDSLKWPTQSLGGYITETGGELKMTGVYAGNYYIQTSAYSTSDIPMIITAKTKTLTLPANGWSPVMWWQSTIEGASFLDHPTDSNYCRNDGTWINHTGRNLSEWHKEKIILTSTSGWIAKAEYQDTASYDWAESLSNTFSETYYIRVGPRHDNSDYGLQAMDGRVAYIHSRKYTSPEPTTQVGSEEIENEPPAISSVSDIPDPLQAGNDISFEVSWSDSDAGDQTKIHICKTDVITTQTCGGGSWCDTTEWSITSPTSCDYTTQVGDIGTKNYYAFISDDSDETSTSTTGTFEVIANATSTISSISDAPDPIPANSNILFTVNWSDPGDQTKIHICKTDAITGQTCDGGSWCDSSEFSTSSPSTCTYTTQLADFGIQSYYAFVCDSVNNHSIRKTGTFEVILLDESNSLTLATTTSSGFLVSSVFDSRVNGGASFHSLLWQGTLCSSCFVKFQLASSNASSGPWNYYGPTSTSDYYILNPGVAITLPRNGDAAHQNKRYIRYKVYLDPYNSQSPEVDDIIINWSP